MVFRNWCLLRQVMLSCQCWIVDYSQHQKARLVVCTQFYFGAQWPWSMISDETEDKFSYNDFCSSTRKTSEWIIDWFIRFIQSRLQFWNRAISSSPVFERTAEWRSKSAVWEMPTKLFLKHEILIFPDTSFWCTMVYYHIFKKKSYRLWWSCSFICVYACYYCIKFCSVYIISSYL